MKLNNIDLNKLQVFHAVIKHKTYTEASDKINLTKSAISQSISTLESQLGLQLFMRKGKKLIPTKEALKLYNTVDLYQKNLLENLSSFDETSTNLGGTIHIGAYLEFAKKQLAKPIKDFLDLHPNVQIKLRFDSPSRLEKLLIDDHIDLCFSIFPVKGIKSIQSKKILKEELVLICPKGWKAKFKHLDDIVSGPIIDYFEKNQSITKWLSYHYQKRYKKLPVRLYASTAEMVLEAVKNEIGIGVVPHYLVGNDVNSNDVQIIKPTDVGLTDYIWLNQFKEQTNGSPQKVFSDFITKWFGVS